MYILSATIIFIVALCASRIVAQTPVSTAACPDQTILSLKFAEWLWTTEVQSSLQSAPVGSRAFRFTPNLPFPPGQQVTGGIITIAADDEYALFVQGEQIGAGNNVQLAQAFEFTLPAPTNKLTVAVNGTNTGSQAGFIATVQLKLQCGSIETIPTAGSLWKFSLNFPVGWQDPGFDDSAWPRVFDEGPYGIKPWGNITIPPASTPPSRDP
ncbi:hypothetical protein GALMADRAFT_258663 [Galerina marginata CBS 339.88]|uniref:Carbohydrate-binding domain-containing protein n=1 Tax=Galerina marginata (strain CBS 339.88) TaxID=685588 RepID=A0A067SAM9_GALM3|nr:hypothetical protein GALMADRAFT_258663 [Galerina marginata CBS 339.88]